MITYIYIFMHICLNDSMIYVAVYFCRHFVRPSGSGAPCAKLGPTDCPAAAP